MTTTPANYAADIDSPATRAPLVLVPFGMLTLAAGNVTLVGSKQMTLLLGAGTTAIILPLFICVVFALVRGWKMEKDPNFNVPAFNAAIAARKERYAEWREHHKRTVTYFKAQAFIMFALWVVVIAGSTSSMQNQHYLAAAAGALMLISKTVNTILRKVTKQPRR